MAKGAGASSQILAGTTASAEACLLITWCTKGSHCSWVPWYMVLDPSPPMNFSFLFMGGHRIFVVEVETKQEMCCTAMMLTLLCHRFPFLHRASSYWPMSFHFTLKDSVEHFFWSVSSGNEFSQLLFIWKCFNFSLTLER